MRFRRVCERECLCNLLKSEFTCLQAACHLRHDFYDVWVTVDHERLDEIRCSLAATECSAEGKVAPAEMAADGWPGGRRDFCTDFAFCPFVAGPAEEIDAAKYDWQWMTGRDGPNSHWERAGPSVRESVLFHDSHPMAHDRRNDTPWLFEPDLLPPMQYRPVLNGEAAVWNLAGLDREG